MLSVLVYTTISILALLITGYLIDNENIQVFGFILLILVLIFGWFALGTSVVDKSIKKKANVVEVIKGKHIAVVICIYDTIESINIIKDLRADKVNDSTTFYWYIGYNCYGGEYKRSLLIDDEKVE